MRSTERLAFCLDLFNFRAFFKSLEISVEHTFLKMTETGIPISTTPTNIPKPSVDQSNHALLEDLYRKMHQAKLEAEAAKKEAGDARKQLEKMRKERIEVSALC